MVREEAGEWHHIHAARFKHLHLHLTCPLHFPLCVCVLDAPSHFEATSPFATILVPRGHELDWVFCTSNGLWDLLFSASVSRLVVLRRLTEQQEEEEEQHGELPRRDQEGYFLEMRAIPRGNVCIDAVVVANKEKEQEEGLFKYTHYLKLAKNKAARNSNEHETDRHHHAQVYCASGDHQLHPIQTEITALENDSDDAPFKRYIAPLLHLLFPWSICPGGPAPDTYVTYEDHVQARLILEMRRTETLGGGVLVEDVELGCSLDDGLSVVGIDSAKCMMPRLRRRMRFQHMPNLIQTEMLIAVYKNGQFSSIHGLMDVKAAQEKLALKNGLENGSLSEPREVGAASQVEFEVRIDHSKLVHKYLPPIVAGLVLATPCLEACMAANQRARFLTIGLGGGALPIFLQRQFGFSVVAVDTDEIVVDLARRHFGFVENEYLQVQVMDGMDMVFGIAHQACNNGLVSAQMVKKLRAAMEDSARGARQQPEIVSAFGCSDARMHVIVVDVNAADAYSGLLSPPRCFLSKAFLLAVRIALHEGGMLVINVIPRVTHNLKEVVDSLHEVFSGVYQIQIEDHHVLFVFLSRIADINMGSDFALRLAHTIGDNLFDKIEEIE